MSNEREPTLEEQIEALEDIRVGKPISVATVKMVRAAARTLRELQKGKPTQYVECYNCGAEVEFKEAT